MKMKTLKHKPKAHKSKSKRSKYVNSHPVQKHLERYQNENITNMKPLKRKPKTYKSESKGSKDVDSHTKNWIRCPHCTRKFKQKNDLDIQCSSVLKKNMQDTLLLRERSQSPQCFSCMQCGNSKWVHISLEKGVVVDSPQKKPFKCDSCDFDTVKHEELRNHIFIKHVSMKFVTSFECELCRYKTFDEGALKEHVLEKHVDPQQTEWFCCEMCSGRFREGVELKKHVFDKHIL